MTISTSESVVSPAPNRYQPFLPMGPVVKPLHEVRSQETSFHLDAGGILLRKRDRTRHRGTIVSEGSWSENAGRDQALIMGCV